MDNTSKQLRQKINIKIEFKMDEKLEISIFLFFSFDLPNKKKDMRLKERMQFVKYKDIVDRFKI